MAALQYSKSYEVAFEEAKASSKGVMVMLTKENCPACWYMENVVFENDDVIKALESKFITVHLDIHKDDLHGLTYIGTPTFYFLNRQAKTLTRIDGAVNLKDFMKSLDAIK